MSAPRDDKQPTRPDDTGTVTPTTNDDEAANDDGVLESPWVGQAGAYAAGGIFLGGWLAKEKR